MTKGIRWRRGALAVLAGAALVAGGCGDTPKKTASGGTTTSLVGASTTSTTAAVPHSAPRWETVTTLSGTGPATTEAFSILPDAIQWRARWSCPGGHLRLRTIPPPRRGEPMVDAACEGHPDGPPTGPDAPVGYSITTGAVRLQVEAAGPWQVIVDQQIDTPLLEPPLPGMEPGAALAQGDFYDVEMKGKGTARLYRLPDGRLAVRLEGFEVSNNTDLFLWASEAPSPHTSADAVAAKYVSLGNLKSTLGDENYTLPADLTADRVRSLVVWCAPVRVAYIAATLGPPR